MKVGSVANGLEIESDVKPKSERADALAAIGEGARFLTKV
jgi:hypothetical protein